QNRLEAWTEKMNSQGRYEIVRENTQLWNIVLDNFDQLVEILGDQEVNLKEYLRSLEAGLASLEVGIIPTTIDQVLVGSIQRSKSHDIRGLLVLGVNEGLLPSGQLEDSLLSETEKEILLARGLDLGFELNRHLTEERFLIYTALSKPSQYLGLSYALADGEGKALRPSLLIDRLQRIFAGLQIHSDVVKRREQELHQIAAPASTFKYLIENLRRQIDGKSGSDFWPDVYRWYAGQSLWQERLSLVQEGLRHRNQVGLIGAENARRLYTLPLHSTVSRVEQFVRCPFAHFVRYGLKPQERKIYEVGAPDIGELFHNCLLTFAGQLQRENLSWKELARPESDRIMDAIMDQLVPEHGHGVFASTHRYRYLVQRLKRISRRTVWTLTEHLQRGDFEPLLHEVSFGPGCPLPALEIEMGNGETFFLVGRIDRVDLLAAEAATMVKVIDYKSGQQDFKLSDVYHGLSLQLIIYLQAILAGKDQLQLGELKPGGVFYFKIDDPLIDTQARLVEIIEREIAKKFRMKGLVLKDVELVHRLDRDIAATGSTDILPLTLTVNGSFSQKSSVLDEDDFKALLRHVEGLLRQIGNEIMRGQVKIEPVKQKRTIACTFCPYQAICQFDRLLEDNNYRNIRPLSDEEVAARIQAAKEVATDAHVD
ncbi:MAG: PD-(D/E)XK nuclease family protein, partial [Firmicutes bacterium]|nr:PD-(D/E)XK nuclease family protein [Bacillota bacterium]